MSVSNELAEKGIVASVRFSNSEGTGPVEFFEMDDGRAVVALNKYLDTGFAISRIDEDGDNEDTVNVKVVMKRLVPQKVRTPFGSISCAAAAIEVRTPFGSMSGIVEGATACDGCTPLGSTSDAVVPSAVLPLRKVGGAARGSGTAHAVEVCIPFGSTSGTAAAMDEGEEEEETPVEVIVKQLLRCAEMAGGSVSQQTAVFAAMDFVQKFCENNELKFEKNLGPKKARTGDGNMTKLRLDR